MVEDTMRYDTIRYIAFVLGIDEWMDRHTDVLKRLFVWLVLYCSALVHGTE